MSYTGTRTAREKSRTSASLFQSYLNKIKVTGFFIKCDWKFLDESFSQSGSRGPDGRARREFLAGTEKKTTGAMRKRFTQKFPIVFYKKATDLSFIRLTLRKRSAGLEFSELLGSFSSQIYDRSD